MFVNFKSLVGLLNATTRQALEGSIGLCLSLGHLDVEIEHLLLQLLEPGGGDIHKIVEHFGVSRSKLTSELENGLSAFKRGAARPVFSTRIVDLLCSAWLFGSVDLGARKIRGGHVIVALLGDDRLSRDSREMSTELKKISPEALRKDFFSICEGSLEADVAPPGAWQWEIPSN